MSEAQSFVMNAVQPSKALSSGLALNIQKFLLTLAPDVASELQTEVSEELCFVSDFVISKD